MNPIGKRALILTNYLVGITLFFSAGCAHNVLVAPKQPEKSFTEKIPLDVGLYMTNDFKGYNVSESRLDDRWNYINLGEASSVQFQLGLGQIFRKV